MPVVFKVGVAVHVPHEPQKVVGIQDKDCAIENALHVDRVLELGMAKLKEEDHDHAKDEANSHLLGHNTFLPTESGADASLMDAAVAAAMLPREAFVHILRVIVIQHMIKVPMLLRVYYIVHGGPLTALKVKAHHYASDLCSHKSFIQLIDE